MPDELPESLNAQSPADGRPAVLRSPWLFRCADLFLLVALQAQVVVFWAIGGEDYLISFRYARNLARGDGLVYNPGEYVEGITNLLWTVSLAGLHRLGLTLNASFYLMAFVYTAGAFLLVRWASLHTLGRASWTARLPLLLMACMTALPASYGNGLEGSATGFGVALLVAGSALVHIPVLSAGGAFLLLDRPDTMLYVALTGLWVLGMAWSRVVTWRRFWLFASVVGATAVGLVLFRLWYFGDYIPNSVRAKSPDFSQPHFIRIGFDYVRSYAAFLGWPLLFLTLAAVFHRRRDLFLLYGAMLLGNAFVVLVNGGDWMIQYRLMTPFFPALAFLAGLAVAALWRWRRAAGMLASIACCALAVRLIDADEIRQNASRLRWVVNMAKSDGPGGEYALSRNIAVRDFREADDRFMVESGGLPAFLLDGVYVIEMNGLMDREIATLSNPYARKRANTGTINWIEAFKKEPTYILFNLASTWHYVNMIDQVPGLREHLDRFVVAQVGPASPASPVFALMLIRDDRKTLPKFLLDYGAFAPATDFIGEEYGRDYSLPVFDTGAGVTRHELLMSPWDRLPWKYRDGEDLPVAWNQWNDMYRLSCVVPVRKGTNQITRPLHDGAPVVFVVGAAQATAPKVSVSVSVETDGVGGGTHVPTVLSGRDEAGAGDATFRTWFLGVQEWDVSAPARIVLTLEAEREGEILLAAHRWCAAPLPELPGPGGILATGDGGP